MFTDDFADLRVNREMIRTDSVSEPLRSVLSCGAIEREEHEENVP